MSRQGDFSSLLDLRTPRQEPTYVFVPEFLVGRVAGRTSRMAPKRGDRQERHRVHKAGLVASIAHREIEVGLRRHVEERHPDRAQRLGNVSTETGRGPDIMLLPGATLQNQVVG